MIHKEDTGKKKDQRFPRHQTPYQNKPQNKATWINCKKEINTESNLLLYRKMSAVSQFPVHTHTNKRQLRGKSFFTRSWSDTVSCCHCVLSPPVIPSLAVHNGLPSEGQGNYICMTVELVIVIIIPRFFVTCAAFPGVLPRSNSSLCVFSRNDFRLF